MKDFEIKLTEKEKTEVQANKQQEKEYKLVGKLRHVAGLTLFEYNTITKELKKATFKKIDAVLDLSKELTKKTGNPFLLPLNDDGTVKPKPVSNVAIKPDCIYREALNFKNICKVLKRELGDSIEIINAL